MKVEISVKKKKFLITLTTKKTFKNAGETGAFF